MDINHELVENTEQQVEKKEQGATMVEYALLVALIAVIAIAAVTMLGTNVSTKFSTVGHAIGNQG